MPPKVKICGLRRLEDARLAADLGASALGFVFWPPSPRAIDAGTARAITSRLPPFVAAVGVFVNQPPEEVVATASRAGVSVIQLHGDEDASAYTGCGFRVIKALPIGPGFTMAAVDGVPADMTVLVDAHDPVRRGGTGRQVEWGAAAAVAARRPTILSGGLNPDNVREAIRIVRPYAVDVSSGVESAPGVKDETALRAFFAALQTVTVA
jgi:phosphoribosylanthranilate isomerase